jgi:hypothetical protein
LAVLYFCSAYLSSEQIFPEERRITMIDSSSTLSTRSIVRTFSTTQSDVPECVYFNNMTR